MTESSPLEAAAAIRAHHLELAHGLRSRVDELVETVRAGAGYRDARDGVLAFLEEEILPHAAAEETSLYGAADPGPAALLVVAMRAEHLEIRAHVDALREADDPVDGLVLASAALALFESHLAEENDQLVPWLVEHSAVPLGELLAGMHELMG